MRRALCASLIAAVLLVRVHAEADDFLFDRFAGYLESLRVQVNIPGLAAAVVGRTDVLWEGAFGQQDLAQSIATRPDTPFHLDGLTQIFTASIVLRCVEEGRLSLDEPIGTYRRNAPESAATLRQLLTHTFGPADNLSFAYRPERLEPLSSAVRACTGDSFRETLANLLDRIAAIDSVPGPDVIHLVPPAEGVLTSEFDRYSGVLNRLAVPYFIDRRGRATPSQYRATTLTTGSGLISTVRDLAKFDVALRRGVLLRDDTLAAAWTPATSRAGQPLPHGTGWFVQTYLGERVVWQFGAGENASSSLLVSVPARGVTMILLANSDGLAKSFPLQAGDVTTSPFAKLFLGLYVR